MTRERFIWTGGQLTPDKSVSIHFHFIKGNNNLTSNNMKISNHSSVPVYTISGSSTARPLPEWLVKKRKRSLKKDPEYASRIELLQDFEFEEASQCIRVSDDGQWVMSTGALNLYDFPPYFLHSKDLLEADALVIFQAPTSLRYTRTICLTCRFLSLGTRYL